MYVCIFLNNFWFFFALRIHVFNFIKPAKENKPSHVIITNAYKRHKFESFVDHILIYPEAYLHA